MSAGLNPRVPARALNYSKRKRACLLCSGHYYPRLPLRAPFSTSHIRPQESEEEQPITAAPEIDFDAPGLPTEDQPREDQITLEKFQKLRIVPTSPSYFTARPRFTDDWIKLQSVAHKWQRLPTTIPSDAPRVAWKSINDYSAAVGYEQVRRSRYNLMLQIARRLNLIVPEMRPQEVQNTIDRYSRGFDSSMNRPNPIEIDEWGRARAVGRRKSSAAQVWLVEGAGEVLVNGKSLADIFARVHDRESALWALKATDRINRYNVWSIVQGGGTTGQAEALTLGIAKALLAHEPLLKKTLRRAGCVTRDPRQVERKKPGHVKARKMPTWVKR